MVYLGMESTGERRLQADSARQPMAGWRAGACWKKRCRIYLPSRCVLGAADLEPCDVAAIGSPRAGACCASIILSAHSYQSGAGSLTYAFAFSRTIITNE